jgi:peroxiredoxin
MTASIVKSHPPQFHQHQSNFDRRNAIIVVAVEGCIIVTRWAHDDDDTLLYNVKAK